MATASSKESGRPRPDQKTEPSGRGRPLSFGLIASITLLLLSSSLQYAAEPNAAKSNRDGASAMVAVEGGTLPGKPGPVAAFSISKNEVTWGEWKAVAAWASMKGYDIGRAGAGRADDQPVFSITWHDAVKWCNAKSEKDGRAPVYTVNGATYKSGEAVPEANKGANGYRLPSEAEWEWAARGAKSGKNEAYSGSNTIGDVAWYDDNSSGEVKAVGTKAANAIGLYDMSGNVWEWCWDSAGTGRSVRGGSCASSAESCMVSARLAVSPDERLNVIGFRIVSSPGK